ncbi:MAG: peptide-methionine (S)-S-oxide reductase MsrA [Gammaproteobacteria bacterium]|nr:peptide-methionine (S)-S-oxide reductase MsrA [Gammaproteobacteria bacterium]
MYYRKGSLLVFLFLLSFNTLSQSDIQLRKAYFAGGCFWGVEYFFEKQIGVITVTSGYMGGELKHPTSWIVNATHSDHIELVEVLYNPQQISYESLARIFYQIHDPTQLDQQGPDIGEQYASTVFYNNDEEKMTNLKLISLLRENGYDVVTVLRKADTFWRAETAHQDYYAKSGDTPYCHSFIKRF